MAIICNKYHSTRDFSYHADTKSFVAEASDFGPGNHDGMVYDDAADVGFVLVSHKTGDSVLVAQDGVDMNGEEIAGWRYKVIAVQGQHPGQWVRPNGNPQYDFSVLVIND